MEKNPGGTIEKISNPFKLYRPLTGAEFVESTIKGSITRDMSPSHPPNPKRAIIL